MNNQWRSQFCLQLEELQLLCPVPTSRNAMFHPPCKHLDGIATKEKLEFKRNEIREFLPGLGLQDLEVSRSNAWGQCDL